MRRKRSPCPFLSPWPRAWVMGAPAGKWGETATAGRWRPTAAWGREDAGSPPGGKGRPLLDAGTPDVFPCERGRTCRNAKAIQRKPVSGSLCIRVYFIKVTITAFWACSRFSASSKISFAWASNTSAVISSPRWAGRQCCTMQSSCAAARSSAPT